MKKLLAILLAITCIFSLATVSVTAAEADSKAEVFENAISQFSRDGLFDYMGSVAIGGDFDALAASIYATTMTTWVNSFEDDFVNPWEDYKVIVVEGSEYSAEEAYYVVPETEFLSVLEKYFALTDATKAALKEMPTNVWEMGDTKSYNAQDKTYTIQPSMGGGPTGSIYRGYTYSGEEGIYDIYSILVDYMDGLEAPTEDMVEWTDYYHEVSEDYEAYYNTYKIIKSRVDFNGDIVKFLSYEEIEEMPEFLITEESIETKTEKENITVKAEAGVFPSGTEITVDEIKSGELYDNAKKALADKGDKFIAFDINAYVDEIKVQPDGEVEVTINIPDGFNPDKLEAYYIPEEGEPEKIECEVNETNKYAKLTLKHFSVYALVEVNTADANTGTAEEIPAPEEKPSSPKTGDSLFVIIPAAVFAAAAAFSIRKARKA